MEMFKTLVFFSDFDTEGEYLIDTVWHEGSWWLAPPPLIELLATGERIPERLVRMDGVFVRFQEVQNQPYRFVLNNSIPKAVLDGKEQGEYEVATYPAASRIQGPASTH